MKTVTKKLYEAMFLVDSALAASDWDGVNKNIERLMSRAKAEVVSIRKWDERKLAYDVNGKARGTYILCYFRADGEKIAAIERDAQLSEQIMRVLILSAEELKPEEIDKETPVARSERLRETAVREAAAREAAASKAAANEAAREEPADTEPLDEPTEPDKPDKPDKPDELAEPTERQEQPKTESDICD
ncbi:MAG: 30S ribosomal protein S6 [Planctomycetota bacterium]